MRVTICSAFGVGEVPALPACAFGDQHTGAVDAGRVELYEFHILQRKPCAQHHPATITLRNRPEEPFTGIVRQLPYAFSGGASGGDSEDTRVRIQFDNPPANLTLGELATVVIVLEEKEDVLWLPPAALRTFQGRTFVVIEEATGQRRADVRLGIESDARVEILEGVEVGDVILGE